MLADFVRNICTQLPAVTTDVKWDTNECYLVANKIFCVISLDEPFSVTLKCEKEIFNDLIENDGVAQAPYFIRGQWINIKKPTCFTTTQWHQLITNSYQLIVAKLSKKEKLLFNL